jgi:hypothetical protein
MQRVRCWAVNLHFDSPVARSSDRTVSLSGCVTQKHVDTHDCGQHHLFSVLALAVGATKVGQRLQVDIGNMLDDHLEATSFISVSRALFWECNDNLVLEKSVKHFQQFLAHLRALWALDGKFNRSECILATVEGTMMIR